MGISTLKRGLYLDVKESRSPYPGVWMERTAQTTSEANMKFAPSSVQIVIVSLLAAFLLTACGDQTPSREPAQQEEPQDDEQEVGDNPTPQVPVE